MTGQKALDVLLAEYCFATVLDVGAGSGAHAQQMSEAGKVVLTVNLNGKADFTGRYEDLDIQGMFDCVWCCHVLEHQPNVNRFLRAIHRNLKPGGVLAITVPPLKHNIVGGHLTLWNAGLLLYNLVLAGFNCRHARVIKAGYNITAILNREEIELPSLRYDGGDIDRLADFFPPGCSERFDGRVGRGTL